MLYDWAESKTMKADVSLALQLDTAVLPVSGCVGSCGSTEGEELSEMAVPKHTGMILHRMAVQFRRNYPSRIYFFGVD
jgi:hypothetical protein